MGLKNIAIIPLVFIFYSCAENAAKEKEENPVGIRVELTPTEVKTYLQLKIEDEDQMHFDVIEF